MFPPKISNLLAIHHETRSAVAHITYR